jgi:hypothetical protein
MPPMFTVNLTRGAYVVNEPDAQTILDAVAKKEPHTLVRADILGDGIVFNAVRLVTAHIVSIVQNKAGDALDHASERWRPDSRSVRTFADESRASDTIEGSGGGCLLFARSRASVACEGALTSAFGNPDGQTGEQAEQRYAHRTRTRLTGERIAIPDRAPAEHR